MEEFRVDPRVTTLEAQAMYIEQGRKLFAFNQTIPFTPENIEATKALFGENLGEGAILRALKGIEVSKGNSLTINGPGALTIDGCDENKSGIGAFEVGIITIKAGHYHRQHHLNN